MTLEEHAKALLAAVEAAEEEGFEVRIKTRSCNCCNDGVWISDPQSEEEAELYIY